MARASRWDHRERWGPVPEGPPPTLAEWRQRFGGSLRGTVTDPFGGTHEISLERFGDLDDDVFIHVGFEIPRPGHTLGEVHGEVVLGHFEVPAGAAEALVDLVDRRRGEPDGS